MMSRTISAPLLLAASVGVPYVASNTVEWTQQIRGAAPPSAAATAPNGLVAPATSQPALPAPAAAPAQPLAAPAAAAATPTAPANVAALIAPPQGPGSNLFPNQTHLEGQQSYSIGDVLRMDVTKEWVYQRWPRKSTALAELGLFGVRVPLVTGTQLYDLAGSLTYYFGADGRVKKIAFVGRTGDTTQLAAIAHQRFGLQAQPTPIAGEQLLQYRSGDDVLSELRTSPAPVLWSSTPHESFAVELVLQDPHTAKPLQRPLASGPVAAPAAQAGAAAPAGQTTAAAPAAQPPAAPPAAEPAEPLGWKAFFPRSRLPKAQVNNLDQANLYQ